MTATAIDAHDGVEVGTIVIAEAACFVDDLGHFQNAFVELTHGIGSSDHQTCGIGAHSCFQSFHDRAKDVGVNFFDRENFYSIKAGQIFFTNAIKLSRLCARIIKVLFTF